MHSILKKIAIGTGDLLKDKYLQRLNVLKRAISLGCRVIDSAEIYYNGNVNKLLSKIDKNCKIINKVNYLKKNSKNYIIESSNSILDSIKRKKIDYLLTHWSTLDSAQNLTEQITQLKKSKKIVFFGLGNPTVNELKMINNITNNQIKVIEIEYNIFNFFYQKKIMKYCNQKKIKVFAYSPFKYALFKKINKHSSDILIKIKKDFKLNFYQVCIIFCIINKTTPILSIKNNHRLNEIVKIGNKFNNKKLSRMIKTLSLKLKCYRGINPKNLIYLEKNKCITLKKKKIKKNIIKKIKKEITNFGMLKPIYITKYENKYQIIDGKSRAKAFYLNSPKKLIPCIVL
jgi:diketogulonate reductase-like aldo/keto reductase